MQEEDLNNEADSEELGTSEFENSELEADESGTSDNLEASEDENDEGTSDDEEDLLPGRFKAGQVKELTESYKNLEATYSRQANEIHQLKQQLNQKPPVNPKEQVEQFAKELKENPVKAIENLSKGAVSSELQELRQAEFKRAYDTISSTHSDFKELEPVMMNLAEQYAPYIEKAGIKNNPIVLQMLYGLAKGTTVQDQLAAAEKSGKQQGQKSAAKKRKARVEGASGSRKTKKLDISKMTSEQIAAEIDKGNLD